MKYSHMETHLFKNTPRIQTILLLLVSGFMFRAPWVSAKASCQNPPAVTGYASPCPTFSLSTYSIPQSGTLTGTITPTSGATQYIYTTGYVYNGSSWLAETIQGSSQVGNSRRSITIPLMGLLLVLSQHHSRWTHAVVVAGLMQSSNRFLNSRCRRILASFFDNMFFGASPRYLACFQPSGGSNRGPATIRTYPLYTSVLLSSRSTSGNIKWARMGQRGRFGTANLKQRQRFIQPAFVGPERKGYR
jgi:hypothetical protein